MKVHISGGKGDERCYVKHNPDTNILIVEVTENVETFIIASIGVT